MLTPSEIDHYKRKILSKIGEPCEFTDDRYPGGIIKGIYLDRVVTHSTSFHGLEDFFNVVDSMELDYKGTKQRVIRFGYYTFTKKDHKFVWGQRALMDSLPIIHDLLALAYREKAWFREFWDGIAQG